MPKLPIIQTAKTDQFPLGELSAPMDSSRVSNDKFQLKIDFPVSNASQIDDELWYSG
jgi:hypothetical protein